MNKIKILMLIIIIAIITTTLLLIIVLPNLKEKEILELQSQVLNEDILDIQEEISYKAYSIILNCIENYIQYNNEADEEKLSAILEETAIIEKYDEIYYLQIEKIYKIERINDTTYFVKTILDDKNVYFVVNVDYITKSYNIRKSTESEFENARENKVAQKYLQSIEIENNENNEIYDKDLTNKQIANKYFYNYIKLAVNKPEIAFNILEKNYKLKKFNNDINSYKEYVEENKEKIINSAIINLKVEAQENYKKYVIQDVYERTYTITEYNYSNYTIELEEYEFESDEEKEEYSKLSSKEKVKSNIEKIFKLLDEKEYSKVYEKLNDEFRKNNFSTLESFKQYARNTFFDYNMLGQIVIEEQGTNYVIIVPYKDGTSSAAEKRTKTFVMKLLEGTEFEISFQIN